MTAWTKEMNFAGSVSPSVEGPETATGTRRSSPVPEAASPDLEIKRITKSFEGRLALDDVTFTVERGEFLAIMGPSGCGKTTLLRIIAGLETADSGALPHLNVRRNIEFGLKLQKLDRAAIDAKVAQIAEMVRLTDLLESKVTVLSGGQRQRVAIARALLAEPRILILDDATSSVDATTENRIKSALAEVMKGRTTFVIAHRLSTIALADEVVVLEDGEIVARGTHDDLLEDSPLYREIAEKGLPGQVFLTREDPEREVAGL